MYPSLVCCREPNTGIGHRRAQDLRFVGSLHAAWSLFRLALDDDVLACLNPFPELTGREDQGPSSFRWGMGSSDFRPSGSPSARDIPPGDVWWRAIDMGVSSSDYPPRRAQRNIDYRVFTGPSRTSRSVRNSLLISASTTYGIVELRRG